jgi:hypothetical protein
MRVAPISLVGSILCGQTPVFTISSDASAFRRRSFWDARLVAARIDGRVPGQQLGVALFHLGVNAVPTQASHQRRLFA